MEHAELDAILRLLPADVLIERQFHSRLIAGMNPVEEAVEVARQLAETVADMLEPAF